MLLNTVIACTHCTCVSNLKTMFVLPPSPSKFRSKLETSAALVDRRAKTTRLQAIHARAQPLQHLRGVQRQVGHIAHPKRRGKGERGREKGGKGGERGGKGGGKGGERGGKGGGSGGGGSNPHKGVVTQQVKETQEPWKRSCKSPNLAQEDQGKSKALTFGTRAARFAFIAEAPK